MWILNKNPTASLQQTLVVYQPFSRCNLIMLLNQYAQVSKEMPCELSQVLRKCLEKQAKDRPSAQELLQLPSIAEVRAYLGLCEQDKLGYC
jgi:hypothetical protein